MILIEAEQFKNTGGWVIDQQFIDQMGSPFLLAHGLGKAVEDATTETLFPVTGSYHVWVRTRDWSAPWKKKVVGMASPASDSPGRFQLLVNNAPLATVFGTENADWHWQYGGEVLIDQPSVTLTLRDLTGFDGRCDAILFSQNKDEQLPDGGEELIQLRRKLLGTTDVGEAGLFDLVVVGGGIAGICAAVSAARYGLQVALIQDRPIVGGNNSSEVRVQLGGKVNMEPYPALGNLVNELDPKQVQNARPAAEYKDYLKMELIENEPGVHFFPNIHVNEVSMNGSQIKSVTGQHTVTGERMRFHGKLFADCSGDANLGYLAGADYRLGRESTAATGESLAPEVEDNMTMGSSVMWFSVEDEEENLDLSFPDTPWALQFDHQTCQKARKGDWDWETGLGRHQVDEFEYIRDYGLRAVFGNWSFLKNKSLLKEDYKQRRLEWVAYVAGKRESRRLMGDVILQQQDIDTSRKFPDGCVTTTWSIDLHNPRFIPGFEDEPFRARCVKTKIQPYAIPYRSLYSRNISNMFMAGRNISVTHVALGTVRVMKTTGMMGEVVGMAAHLCAKHDVLPRAVYEKYLDEFKVLLREGVPSSSAILLEENAVK
jgi:hypothetical protein